MQTSALSVSALVRCIAGDEVGRLYGTHVDDADWSLSNCQIEFGIFSHFAIGMVDIQFRVSCVAKTSPCSADLSSSKRSRKWR